MATVIEMQKAEYLMAPVGGEICDVGITA